MLSTTHRRLVCSICTVVIVKQHQTIQCARKSKIVPNCIDWHYSLTIQNWMICWCKELQSMMIMVEHLMQYSNRCRYVWDELKWRWKIRHSLQLHYHTMQKVCITCIICCTFCSLETLNEHACELPTNWQISYPDCETKLQWYSSWNMIISGLM
jgi:hypothetical protein